MFISDPFHTWNIFFFALVQGKSYLHCCRLWPSSRVRLFILDIWPLKMRPLSCVAVLETICPLTMCHVPEESVPQLQHRKNLKTYSPNPCFCAELQSRACEIEDAYDTFHSFCSHRYLWSKNSVMNSVNSKVMESLLWEYDIPQECHVDKYKIIHVTCF